jgi:hypothetical protein
MAEKGLPLAAPFENLGDDRMIHDGECLPSRFESQDDALGGQARLDHPERHRPTDGLRLLRPPNDAAPSPIFSTSW